MKSQSVRLVDIFLLGPFMIWFGVKAGGMPTWARWTLAASGVGTVLYNGANYVRYGSRE